MTKIAWRPRFHLANLKTNRVVASRLAIGIAVVAVLVLGAWALAFKTSALAVDSVEFRGNVALANNDALAISGIDLGTPVFGLDKAEVRQRLQGHPLVGSAIVSSSWSGEVVIEIEERKAVAQAVTSDETWAEIDAEARILRVLDAPSPGLPALVSVTAEPSPGTYLADDLRPLLQTAALLPPSLQGQVIQLQLTDGSIRMGTVDGVIVVVGSVDRLADKLTAAATVLNSGNSEQTAGMETLDVTAPELPVSTMKSQPAPDADAPPTEPEEP